MPAARTNMLADLEQLIRLQELESSATGARDRIAAQPASFDALDARLAERSEAVETAKTRLTEHRTARATVEKEVAGVQGRLTRFKDQLMAVKTNKEYHAIQSEIAGAEAEVQRLEDVLLEQMLEADELSAAVDAAEADLAAEKTAVAEERGVLEAERQELESQLVGVDTERERVAAQLTPGARDLFHTVARNRKGVAVAEAHQGLCMSCRVRLRPQLFNEVRLNLSLIQCESCQRILYFAEHRHQKADGEATPSTQA